MSVQNSSSSIQYQGNGLSVAFAVPFLFYTNQDIIVIVTDADGVDTTLTLSTDYTLTGAGDPNGGTVTTTLVYPPTHTLTIFRQIALTQPTVYVEGGRFPAKEQERALDRVTMIAQQVDRKAGRSLRFRESDGVTPEIAKVLNSVFSINANGDPVFLTPQELASLLNLSQQYYDRPLIVFANEAERVIAVPKYPGQFGIQYDTGKGYIASSIAAGDWIAFDSIDTAQFAALQTSVNLKANASDLANKVNLDASNLQSSSITLAKLASDVTSALSGSLNPAKYIGQITTLSQNLTAPATATAGAWYYVTVAGTLSGTNSGGLVVANGGYLIVNAGATAYLYRAPAPTLIPNGSIDEPALGTALAAKVNDSRGILDGYDQIVTPTPEVIGPVAQSGVAGSTGVLRSSGDAAIHSGNVSTIKFYCNTSGNIEIWVLRPTGTPNQYTPISSVTVAGVGGVVNTFTAPTNFTAIPILAGDIFGLYSTSGQGQAGTTSGLGNGLFVNSAPSVGVPITLASSSSKVRLNITSIYLVYTYETVKADIVPIAGYAVTSATFGPAIGVGSQLTGGLIRFLPNTFNYPTQTITEIVLDVFLAGAFNLYVYSINSDGTLKYESTTAITAGTTGLVTLTAANGDFNAINMPVGALGTRIALQNNGGRTTFVSDADGQYLNSGATGTAETILGATSRPQFQIKVQYQASVSGDISAVTARVSALDTVPISSDARGLHVYRGKCALAAEGVSSVVKVMFLGDSWCERVNIPQRMKDLLGARSGISGHGWISVDSDYTLTNVPPVQQMDGVTFLKTPRASMSNNAGSVADGWVTRDFSYADGVGLDGFAILTTRTDASIAIGNIKTQTFRIFYKDTTGTFRYRTDAGSYTTVTGGGTNAVLSVNITGLTDAIHSFTIDTTGNTGTVVIYGFYATRSASGIEVSKSGNGGATSADLFNTSSYIGAYLSVILPDVVVLIDGTNDNGAVGTTSYKANLAAYISAIKTASPNTVIILVPSPENSLSTTTALLPYTIAGYQLYKATSGVEFFNARELIGPRASSNLWSGWDDSLHLNNTGARCLSSAIIRNLLWI